MRFGFLSALFNWGLLLPDNLFDESDYSDLYMLCNKYAILPSFSKAQIKFNILWPSDVGPYNKLTVFLHVLDKASNEWSMK